MDVAGLCSVCHRPGRLATCPLCGLTGHPQCLGAPAHAHGGLGQGGRGPDEGSPMR